MGVSKGEVWERGSEIVGVSKGEVWERGSERGVLNPKRDIYYQQNTPTGQPTSW